MRPFDSGGVCTVGPYCAYGMQLAYVGDEGSSRVLFVLLLVLVLNAWHVNMGESTDTF